MASTYNIDVDRGTSKQIKVLWKNAETSEAIDISGYAPKVYVRPKKNAPEIVYLSTASGISVDSETNEMTITFTRSQLLGVPAGGYYWELILDGGDESTIRLVDGNLNSR
jgi:hypothetical protein